MKSYQKILFGLAALTIASCAKTRKVEPVGNVDEVRLPKSTFVSQNIWLTKATIVKSGSIGDIGFVGLQSDVKAGTFEFTKEKLVFKRALNNETLSTTLGDVINSWDIGHSEYRLAESGGKVTNKQEENSYLPWNQKQYFTIDFAKADLLPIDSDTDPCWEKISSQVVSESQSIASDRMSFEVDYVFHWKASSDNCIINNIRRLATGQDTQSVRYRFSFIPMPADSGYKPYSYSGETDPLYKKFGYFDSVVESLGKNNQLKNVFLMNRWHPEKTHSFYFDHDFPEEYKWIYTNPEFGVIARTNQLAERNGLKIRFRIEDAPKGFAFGDLGYSFIKFVPESSLSAPLGYGPSDTNPLTGEIISANTTIWTSGLKYYLDRIKADQEAGDERVAGRSDLFKKMQERLKLEDPASWIRTAEILRTKELDNGTREFLSPAGEVFHFLMPEYTFSRSNLYSLGRESLGTTQNDMESIQKTVSKAAPYLAEQTQTSIQKTLQAATTFRAGDLSQFFMHKIYMPSTYHDLESSVVGLDKALLKGVSHEQVIDSILYRTAIHEFGHNLNLRHNFAGSVDAINFPSTRPMLSRKGETIKDEKGLVRNTRALTSSVMDYQSLDDEIEEPWDYGNYDEAAFAFAYSSGEKDLTKTNNNRFLYCTDEHRENNVMCNAYDNGSTPSEVALSLIEVYDNSYKYRNYRFGRAYWNTLFYESSRLSDMMSLRKFLSFQLETYASDMEKFLSNRNVDNLSIAEYRRLIKEDMAQANLLVATFFDAVIRQSTTERPWENEYDNWSGVLKRQGIAADKIYATLFLFGDPSLYYSRTPAPYSYLSLLFSNGERRRVMEDIFKDNLTVAPAMEQGFITFGRSLYTTSVTNYVYAGGSDLYDNINLKCYSANTLNSMLQDGVSLEAFPVLTESGGGLLDEDGNLVSKRLIVSNLSPTAASKVFKPGKEVVLNQASNIGIISYAGNYLVADSTTNPYSFDMIKRAFDDYQNDFNIEVDAGYIYEFYRSLRAAKGIDTLGECK